MEETYFFQFCPDKTGRNWTKLEKTVKDVRNVGRKYLSYLISYKRLWLKMHLVNWYCLKTWCKNIKYFWSISSSSIRTKLEETGWQIEETLQDVRNTGKNLSSYLFSHKRLWSLIHWVDCYCLETWCRKHITLTYFFHFYPDKTWETGWQLTWIMEKIERYQTHRK